MIRLKAPPLYPDDWPGVDELPRLQAVMRCDRCGGPIVGKRDECAWCERPRVVRGGQGTSSETVQAMGEFLSFGLLGAFVGVVAVVAFALGVIFGAVL